MYCPFCSATETRVIDSRLASDGDQVRRRRTCQSCNERFTTYEAARFSMPNVKKTNDVTQSFSEHKLRGGMLRALEKRPVGLDEVESAIIRIKKRLLGLGLKIVPTHQIGQLVMAELRKLDAVAYIRFISVYESFNDIEEFREVINRMERER